jgi:hypothetical protein
MTMPPFEGVDARTGLASFNLKLLRRDEKFALLGQLILASIVE